MNYSDFNQKYNGRQPLVDGEKGKKIVPNEKAIMMSKGFLTGLDGVKNIDQVTALFFADDNIKRIQKKIREKVAEETNGKFILKVDQDENDILVVMRATILVVNPGVKFLPTQIKHQVKELNKQVVDYIIPDMIAKYKTILWLFG